MTAVFPSSLLGPLGGSLSENYNDGIVQDSGEIGPPRKRRRTTRTLRNWSFTMRLIDATQKATWDAFYETTIDYGIQNFTWTLKGTDYTVQLLEPPSVSHIAGDIWDVQLQIGEV